MKSFHVTGALAIALICSAPALLAQSKATNPAVKARQEAMLQIGGGMKVLSDMAKGDQAFDAEAANAAVATIATVSAEIPDLFEAQEDDPESEALPAVWSDWDDFVVKAEALHTGAQSITVTDEASLQPALGTLGVTCKQCHDDFRD
ncbi:c-type cytochrome [Celeribacter indicus]|uniref:Cytochrome c n=1 Tax=Celeribacter indicus TaxID=1208324 RepID=A0A0B5DVQ7_9RHOB|nr:cytochrome c [Celeribacter indicus]AJE45245.1 cytochrome c' [Celeribacter indicus]SDX21653.1 Cytochrome c556 [Celeribacter indicus]